MEVCRMRNFGSTIRKIAALGASVSMVGLTLMGATAQTTTSGASDVSALLTAGALVTIGDGADSGAALDLAKRFGYSTSSTSGGSAGSSDEWTASTSSNKLEIGESLKQIESFISEEELPALKDVEFTNEKGTSSYDQNLYFGDTATSHVVYNEDDDENIGWHFYIQSSQTTNVGGNWGRLALEATDSGKSDVDSNNRYEDFEGETINIGTSAYTIVTWTNATSSALTLMSGSSKLDIYQGSEPQVVNVGDKEYSVSLTFVDGTKARLLVNGESMELNAGETGVTKDGLNVGVSKLYYQGFDEGEKFVEAYIGAKRLLMTSGSSPEVDGETLSEVTVEMDITQSGGDGTWDELRWNITSMADDVYIAPGEKFSEQTELTDAEKNVLTALGLDIGFDGFEEQDTETIEFRVSGGDTKYEILMTNADGTEFTVPVAFANTSGIFPGERTGRELVLANNQNIRKNQYFILNTKQPSASANDARSFVLQYKGRDANSTSSPQASFKVLGGDTLTRPLTTTNQLSPTFTIKLGGSSFSGQGVTGTKDAVVNFSTADFEVVNPNGNTANDANVSIVSKSLRTKGNARINISVAPYNSTQGSVGRMMRVASNGGTNAGNVLPGNVTVGIVYDDTTRTESNNVTLANGLGSFVEYRLSKNSDNEVASARTVTPAYSQTDNEESTVTWFAGRFGTEAKEENPSSSPHNLLVTSPLEQRYAIVKVLAGSGGTAGTTTVSAKASAGVGALATGTALASDLSKGMAVALHSEVPEGYAGNLVHVGGPCVNPGTAEALGLSFPSCGAAAATDVVAAAGDTVAMATGKVGYVYGWTAEDTATAAAGVTA
jgi:hypothetical protein